jgi:catechol 2,3-dioxygenase-like lactoylglutathione lyase family enzyme
MTLSYLRTVPILRSFDEGKAREFYVDFLGFSIDWEHRFEPGLPLYMQVSRAGILIHITEHHGDGSPGANIRIDVTGLHGFHEELTATRYKNMRPGLETPEWGGTEMTVIDPAGNRIIFCEADTPD